MEIDMAPPNKRRRLSGSNADSLPSHSDFIPEEPSPTQLHFIETLQPEPTSPAARTVPQHIDEIHLQIQERAVKNGQAFHPFHRRQATAVRSLVTTINELGQTITTEIVIGATTSSLSPAASGTPDTSGSPNYNSSTSSTPLGSHGTAPGLASSHNSNSTHTSTKDSTDDNAGKATLGPGVYRATLTNGHVVTITRSDAPYKTTFANGEISTICDLNGDCQLAGSESTKTQQSLGDSSPSSPAIAATTSTAYAAGSPAQDGQASPSRSAGADVQSQSDGDTPPAGTIAGGVVGGAAGLAVILLLAMVLLRWYKRRKQLGHHALPPSSVVSPDPDTPTSRGPGMAERAGIRPLGAAIPGFFKHQNRSDIEPPPSERSFQKISGRKLPSAYSEGMSSTDMIGSAPSGPSTGHDRNFSSLSFYRDSQGFYGGEGDTDDRAVSPDDVPPLQSDTGGMMLSPGPQRKPTVHTGGPYNFTPSSSVPSTPNIQSPTLATIPGSPTEHPRFIARSSTPSSMPDNRSSRFTEEV